MTAVTRRRLAHLRLGLAGFALGATVSAVGFSDYGELHLMFTLRNPRLLLAFGGAILLAGLAFAVRCGGGKVPPQPLRKGTIPGALLFGVGWALCGGCPSAVLVQIGEGKMGALVTLGGVLAGTLVGRRIKGILRWDWGSCGF
jgi:hypothetical protein